MENPVPETAFVGVDPEDTLEVPYGGGVFTLGVLPVGLWDRFSTRSMSAYLNSVRRITARLHAEGKDPQQPMVDGETVTLLDEEVFKDEQYLNDMHSIHIGALRYGLRGHQGFVNKKRQAFPFETKTESIDGQVFQVATEKTLKAYRVHTQLLMMLWRGMRKLHELSDDAKKA